MKLGKPLLFLVSTVIGAVSVGSTGLALTKHKPSQTERDVIELEDLQDNIEEKEINPDPAPVPPPPPAPSGGDSSSSSSTSGSSEGGGGESAGSGETQEQKEETTEEVTEEVEDDEDDEDGDDSEDAEDSQDQSDTEPPTEDEIKKSLKEVIEALIEKKDFNIKEAGLFDTYTVSTKLSTLQQLITQYKTLKSKSQDSGASAPGSSAGVGTPGSSGQSGTSAG